MPSPHNIAVLEVVIESLCHYCTPRQPLHKLPCLNAHCPAECAGRDQERRDIVTLAALCLTSKHINAFATPHLYHRPTCRQWPLLARTLLSRPDLAGHVRHLCLRDWISVYFALPDPTFPVEVAEYWDGKVDYHVEAGPGAAAECLEADNIELSLVLPLCPNIEELDVPLGYGDALCFSDAGPMRKLRTVVAAYDDPGSGMNLGSLAPLVPAAPNLSTLVGWQVNACRDMPVLENVTHLRLGRSSMELEGLRRALHACPRLETLEYGAGGSVVGYDQFTPLEAQGTLVELAPRLKSLSLNFDDALSHDALVGEGWVLQSLSGLKSLQKLEMDTRCFVAHMNPMSTTKVKGPNGEWVLYNPGPVPGLGREALVELLPTSIREVHISRGRYGPELLRVVDALEGLAAGAERFSELRRVEVRGRGEESVEGVRSIFEARGVALSIPGVD